MKKALLLTINSLLVGASIISCSGNKKNSEATGCIKPVIEIAYPTGFSEPILEEKEPVLPSFPWEPQTSLFTPVENKSANIYSMALRHHDGFSDQIWLSYYVEEQEFVAYYDPLSKTIVTYSSSDLSYLPRFIYVSSSGIVWGVAYDKVSPQKIFFVRFNDAIEDFEPVSEQIDYFPGDIGAITRDEKDMYWISLSRRDMQTGEKKYTFFSYDAETSETIEYPAVSKIQPISLALAPDKRIWMIVYTEAKWQLAVFNPASEEISIYRDSAGVKDGFDSEQLDNLTKLYFDKSDRLWVDDRGWFDFSSMNSPQWYRIIRSTVFIEEQVFSETPYVWSRPYYMSQSKNGMYWFGSPVGTASLDTSTGTWCHFTTALSPVVEDSQGNLWMVAYGILYKI